MKKKQSKPDYIKRVLQFGILSGDIGKAAEMGKGMYKINVFGLAWFRVGVGIIYMTRDEKS